MSQNKEFILKSDNILEAKEQLILELYKVRKKSKTTQIELSKLTNLPQATISRVESLSFDVTLSTLVKYAEALGIELSIVLKPSLEPTLKEENLITETNNQSIKYLVALQTGGLMEDPNINYSNHQFIEAKTSEEAEDIYNKKNNCSYFYGSCIGIISETEKEILLPSRLSEKILENIEIDEDEIYLVSKIDGGYQECPDLIYSNFNILKMMRTQKVNFDDQINNSCYVVGKYNKQKNTFEIPVYHMHMITSLVNETNKKNYQKRKLK